MRVPNQSENEAPSGASFRLKPRWAWALTARDNRVVREEPYLNVRVLASDVCEISHGIYAPAPYKHCAVPQRG